MSELETLQAYLPWELNSLAAFMGTFLGVTAIVMFRYFLVAGLFWLLFYIRTPQKMLSRQIYSQLPSRDLQVFEIKMSLLTALLFGGVATMWAWMWQEGYTQIYLKLDQFGWGYFLVSGFLASLLHELYFYWTHRGLHHPLFFKKFHSVHHQSLTPSPWASFSFHPMEGLIQALALPLISLLIPLHPLVLLVYLSIMTLSAVSNHLGFELMPGFIWKSWLGPKLISGVHHTQHHRFYRYNFGLFYTFADHWFGTEHPTYHEQMSKKVLK